MIVFNGPQMVSSHNVVSVCVCVCLCVCACVCVCVCVCKCLYMRTFLRRLLGLNVQRLVAGFLVCVSVSVCLCPCEHVCVSVCLCVLGLGVVLNMTLAADNSRP